MSTKQERHFFKIRERSDGLRLLVPSSRLDAEYIRGFNKDTLVEITIHKGRSRQRHRLYWAVLHAVIENHDALTSAESLHKMLLLGCGVTEPFITIDGEILLMPSSTAWAAMSEADFKTYFDHAMALICEKILPGVEIDALLDEGRERSDTGERRAA